MRILRVGLIWCCVAPTALAWNGIAAAASEQPAVEVDLSVLDTLAPVSGPGWTPPLPGHRPIPPLDRPPRRTADPVPTPEPRPDPPARLGPVAPEPTVTTDPVMWQRPIPVTAGAVEALQVGARSTAPALSDKAIGANVDIEATADLISALPNGGGFRILFADDRTALSDTGGRLLDTLVDRMAAEPALRLSVMSYAGGSPQTAPRARLLSLERALAVRNYLFDRGIRGSRIDVRALGNTSVDGPPERVDLLLTD